MPTATAPVHRRTRELESLAGLSAIDAITRLRALELRPAVEPCDSGPEAHGVVLAHEPTAGVDVCRGALVTLLVGEQQRAKGQDEARRDTRPREAAPRTTAPRESAEVRAFAPRVPAVRDPRPAAPSPPPEPAAVEPVTALNEQLAARAPVLVAAPAAAGPAAPASADLDAESPPPHASASMVLPLAPQVPPRDSRKPRSRRATAVPSRAILLLGTPLVLLATALVHPDAVGRAELTVAASRHSVAPARREFRRARAQPRDRARPRIASPLPEPGAGDRPHEPRLPAADPAVVSPDPSATPTSAPVSPVGPLPGPPPSP